MKITNVKQEDSGTWRCNVTCTTCNDGKYDVGTNKIDVIVAIPPGKKEPISYGHSETMWLHMGLL